MLPEAIVLLTMAAVAVALAVVFSPAPRRPVVTRGGAGLLGGAVIALAPSIDFAVVALLGVAVADAVAGGTRTFASRLRLPLLAAAFLTLALAFGRFTGPEVLERFAAVGLVAGLAAAVGIVPYLHPFDPDEPAWASPILWIALVGPVLAAVLVWRVQGVLSVDAGGIFGAALIGLGLLNMAWGSLSAWGTLNVGDAWRYSFVADWGLVLCGLGLTVADGQRAALLLLFSVVLGRLPLYLLSREGAKRAVTERPVNLVAAALLAGSAPFAGFAARVLLLRAATQLFWPLALALVACMLLWLPGSLRLGRSLGLPRRRAVFCVVVVVVLNVIAGLYPLPLFSAAGL